MSAGDGLPAGICGVHSDPGSPRRTDLAAAGSFALAGQPVTAALTRKGARYPAVRIRGPTIHLPGTVPG